MFIATSGNVGIGTTSPNAPLHIVKDLGTSVSAVLRLRGSNSTARTTRLQFEDYNGTIADGLIDFIVPTAGSSTGARLDIGVDSVVMSLVKGGNVGIGTTSPAGKLDVRAGNGGRILFGSYDANYYAAFEGGDQLNFYNGASNATAYINYNGPSAVLLGRNLYVEGNSSGGTAGAVRIDSVGNVGIGTTSPAQKLHVQGSNLMATFRNSSTATNQYTQLEFVAGSRTAYIWLGNQATTSWAGDGGLNIYTDFGNIDFWTANTQKMRLTASGNLLIGTTADSGFKLDVSGSAYISNTATIVGGGNTLLLLKGTGSAAIAFGGTSDQASALIEGISGGGLNVYTSNGGTFTTPNWASRFQIAAAGAATFTSSVTASSLIKSGGTASQYLMADGSVSTLTNPVTGTGTTNYVPKFTGASAIGNSQIFDDGTSVGIGTAAPGSKLEVVSSTTQIADFSSPLVDGLVNIRIYNSAQTTSSGTAPAAIELVGKRGSSNHGRHAWIGAEGVDGTTFRTQIKFKVRAEDSPYQWSTLPTQMVIDGNGNVGIGTTSPGAKLHNYSTATSNVFISGYGTAAQNDWGGENAFFVNANNGIIIGKANAQNDTNRLYTFYNDAAGNAEQYIYNTSNTATIKLDSAGDTYFNGGNVGIGTTAPSLESAGIGLDILNSSYTQLRVRSSSSAAGIEFKPSTGDRWEIQANNSNEWFVYNRTDAQYRLLIDGTGNVGIGTTGPTEKLHVDGSTLITYNNSFQSTNSVGNKAILARVSPTSGIVNYAEYATATNLNGFVIGSDDARVKGNITGDSLEFITNTSTRMTILSGGNVGINTTTPGSTLHVVGDVLIQTGALGVGVNPSATDGRIDAGNDIVAFSTSDKRLKENITPIANALEKVRSLTGVEFDWKEETKSVHGYEGHDVGVIAQDVQAVLPEAVRTNDTGYLSVRYEKMIALLIEANKELATRVEQLEKLIK
jgi:hypothetical protein